MGEKKTIEDLNVIDGFMFNELMMQEDVEKSKEFCRTILEPIIGEKIHNIEIVPQKVNQGIEPDLHGIQMDAYVKEIRDEEGNAAYDVKLDLQTTIYDIEPNLYRITSEEKRARFYHSSIDAHTFKSGVDYEKLQNVVVIFILPYDPFGYDRMLYTVKRKCIEEPEMPYDDGETTIFLYTKGNKNIPSQKLKDMLSFIEESTEENAVDEDLQNIRKMMMDIKSNSEVGVKYLHTWEMQEHIMRKGVDIGVDIGVDKARVEAIKNLMKNTGKTFDESCLLLGISEEDMLRYKDAV